MQYQLPLMCVLNGPKAVPAQVVSDWKSVHDAAVWAFENRDNKTVKTKAWMSQHLQMRTQHVTRLLKLRDLKLDPVQGHMWDCLTGWTAIEQYKAAEVERINRNAAEQINNALKARFAA